MIIFIDSAEAISSDQLRGFFEGWPNPPPPEKHLLLLQNSDYAILALDSETRMVVGFITAISDHVLSAYIPLLEVLPEYQGSGIGSELANRMLKKLEDFYMVDLLCDPKVQPFYARLGMREATGMCLRHYERQSGRSINKSIKKAPQNRI